MIRFVGPLLLSQERSSSTPPVPASPAAFSVFGSISVFRFPFAAVVFLFLRELADVVVAQPNCFSVLQPQLRLLPSLVPLDETPRSTAVPTAKNSEVTPWIPWDHSFDPTRFEFTETSSVRIHANCEISSVGGGRYRFHDSLFPVVRCEIASVSDDPNSKSCTDPVLSFQLLLFGSLRSLGFFRFRLSVKCLQRPYAE